MSRRFLDERRKAIPHLGLALLALVVLASAPAHAQRGVDVDTFRPSLDSYGIFTIDRAETGQQWDWGFKLVADYANNPLSLNMKDPQTGAVAERAMLSYQVALHLMTHFSLANWLELAVDVPLSQQSYTKAYGTNTDPLHPTGFYVADPRSNVPPPDASPLDMRVALKLRTPRWGLVGLAVLAEATLPFGDDSAFLGDSGFTFRPKAIVDVTWVKGFTAAINVGYVLRQKTVVLDPYDVAANRMATSASMMVKPATLIELGDEVSFGAGAAYRVSRWVGLAAEVYGFVPVSVDLNPTDRTAGTRDIVVDVLGGLTVYPGRSVQISVGAGGGVFDRSDAHRRDAFRVFAGVSWVPSTGTGGLGGADSDGDGIPDAQDQCPGEPEDKDGFQDDDGCPDLDNDKDGIPDAQDACPNDPEDKDGYQDDDGCPDPDNDLDGIPDKQDKCPDDAEDKDGYQDDDGCPDLDNDGDGIPDDQDKCPNEPETFNGVDDEDGCPDTVGAAARSEGPARVAFEAGSSRLSPAASAELDRFVARIPGGRRVRVEGHAEEKEPHSRDLASQRAAVVRDYLARKGVAATRITVASNPPGPGVAERRVDASVEP